MKLNYIKTTSTGKVFNIDGKIYFADIEKTNDFSQNTTGNKMCLSVENLEEKKQMLLHNVYDSGEVFYKSAIYSKNKTEQNNNTLDFQPFFTQKIENGISNCVQLNNNFYCLKQADKYGVTILSSDIYGILSIDNGEVSVSPTEISTYLYDYKKVKAEQLSNLNYINHNLQDIEYNALFEIPGKIYNDYESGNILANTYRLKNQYTAEYNMAHGDAFILQGARDYFDIKTNNNVLYLKYYDNQNYKKEISASRRNFNIKTIKESSETGLYNSTLPNIEVIHLINRYISLKEHKSPVYSLVVTTPIISFLEKYKHNLGGPITENVIENIKTEIASCIREIVEKLNPAQTQLFKIEIK